ncbi:STAS domain-containing protein [Bacillus sp. 1P06AnD]|uniref:STAS domain-containing protein n=1 Tax=Bacillus sp. 1P06AnD TaxID=3132208 RepID=UPI0039A3ED7B
MGYEVMNSVSKYLEEDKTALLEDILVQIKRRSDESEIREINKHKELISALLSEISKRLCLSEEENKDVSMEYDVDRFFYETGTMLSETVEILSDFRIGLIQRIRKYCVDHHIDVTEIFTIVDRVIYIFDMAIRDTTKSFNMSNQEVLENIEQEIMQLSAPIVPIKKGIAVLPLIGNFKENRASYISNVVIPNVSKMKVDVLIVDFSGMHTFDTYVAQRIFQIRDILQLLGIESIITGIRPELAQTAIQLGIDVKDLNSYASVQQVLEELEKKQMNN